MDCEVIEDAKLLYFVNICNIHKDVKNIGHVLMGVLFFCVIFAK